jgi:hypothetical protein
LLSLVSISDPEPKATGNHWSVRTWWKIDHL